MDSTLISTRPDEGTLSLSRARRAALPPLVSASFSDRSAVSFSVTLVTGWDVSAC